MRIQLTQIRYGPGMFQNAGDVIDLPEAEASELVRSGRAIKHAEAEPNAIETTNRTPPRTAAIRTTQQATRNPTHPQRNRAATAARGR